MLRTVIVAEKPSLAKAIASALPKDVEVTSVMGHMVAPVFKEYEDKPWSKVPLEKLVYDPINFKIKAQMKNSVKNLQLISKKPIDHLIIATDPDEQGHKIGSDIISYISKKTTVNKISRWMIEAVIKDEILKSYNELTPIEKKLSYPGTLRSKLDLLFGAILTRYMSLTLFKKNKYWKTYNTGRVQSPTLKAIYDRQVDIVNYTPEKYYVLEIAEGDLKNHLLDKKYDQDPQIKTATITTKEITDHLVYPLRGLNTDTFLKKLAEQHACFSKLGTIVTSLLSNMYLSGKITYPRVENSSYRNYPDLYLSCAKLYEKQTGKKPILQKMTSEDKKTDHGPISPLVTIDNSLSEMEQKVLTTLYRHMEKMYSGVNRYKKYHYLVKSEKLNCKFSLLQQEDIRFNDGVKSVEKLPTHTESQIKLNNVEKTTPIKPRYTPAVLLKKMQNDGIGTKSTRANIIQQLIKNKFITYVDKNKLKITNDGIRTVKFWDLSFKKILDSNLTHQIEEEFNTLQSVTDLECIENKYRSLLYDIVAPKSEGKKSQDGGVV